MIFLWEGCMTLISSTIWLVYHHLHGCDCSVIDTSSFMQTHIAVPLYYVSLLSIYRMIRIVFKWLNCVWYLVLACFNTSKPITITLKSFTTRVRLSAPSGIVVAVWNWLSWHSLRQESVDHHLHGCDCSCYRHAQFHANTYCCTFVLRIVHMRSSPYIDTYSDQET